MVRRWLRDDQWERLESMLPGKAGDPGRTGEDNRLFIEAVLWVARTGSPWRDLPGAGSQPSSLFWKRPRFIAGDGIWCGVIYIVSARHNNEHSHWQAAYHRP